MSLEARDGQRPGAARPGSSVSRRKQGERAIVAARADDENAVVRRCVDFCRVEVEMPGPPVVPRLRLMTLTLLVVRPATRSSIAAVVQFNRLLPLFAKTLAAAHLHSGATPASG